MGTHVRQPDSFRHHPGGWHPRAPERGGHPGSGEQGEGHSRTWSCILGATGSSLGTWGDSEINETPALQSAAGVQSKGNAGEDKEMCPEIPLASQ